MHSERERERERETDRERERERETEREMLAIYLFVAPLCCVGEWSPLNSCAMFPTLQMCDDELQCT